MTNFQDSFAANQQMAVTTFSYDEEKVILYALGIGAGVDELDFVYEKNLKVLPTIATFPAVKALFELVMPYLKLDLLTLLLSEHAIILHKAIPTSGTLYTTAGCKEIYDRGDNGAFIHVSFETRDHGQELLFENHMLLIDRNGGNFGGAPGRQAKPPQTLQDREPDFVFRQTIPTDQCAVYRLSGDKSALHIDPEVAVEAGLPRPVFHGFGTLGYTVRGIVKNIGGGDPIRLKAVATRFTDMVFPGDTLITERWNIKNDTYIFRTTNQGGKLILADFFSRNTLNEAKE